MKVSKKELDRLAKQYHTSENIPDKFIEDLLQQYSFKLIEQSVGPAPGTVLELGFGEGIITDNLVKLGADLTLIEGSSILATQAQQKYSGKIKVECCLFEEYSTNEKYDVILANHVLEHVSDPVAILKKIKGWLKPNSGILIIIVPNSESLHRRIGLLMGLQQKLDSLNDRDKLVGHQRVYSYNELEADIKKAGFEITSSSGYFLKVVSNSMMLQYDSNLLKALLEISSQLPKELLANLFVSAKVK